MDAFNDDQIKRLLKALSDGHFRKTACSYAGVAFSTFNKMMKLAPELRETTPDHPFVNLLDAVVKAEAGPQFEVVGAILEQSREDWKAGAWWLERRHRKDWGKPTQATSSNTTNNQLNLGAITIDLKSLTMEELALLDKISKRLETPKLSASQSTAASVVINTQALPAHEDDAELQSASHDELDPALTEGEPE